MRICSSFRTISTSALMVISGTIPVELQAGERRRAWRKDKRGKVEEREITLDLWQESWEQETHVGQWTKLLIPDVRPWIKRTHGEVNYFLTQILSGHGCFEAYFYRFKLTNTPRCYYCDHVDDAEHTFFGCPQWSDERLALEHLVGERLTTASIVPRMLESKVVWSAVCDTAARIIRAKEVQRKYLQQSGERMVTL